MDTILVKRYLCALCRKTHIIQRVVRHSYDGEIPDHCNCDLNTYSDHQVIGGKLLQNRPDTDWKMVFGRMPAELEIPADKQIPVGGICDTCLCNDESIDDLIKMGSIRFATQDVSGWNRH